MTGAIVFGVFAIAMSTWQLFSGKAFDHWWQPVVLREKDPAGYWIRVLLGFVIGTVFLLVGLTS